MKPATTWVAVITMGAAAVFCGRLGVWQLERLEAKRSANADVAARLALPPRSVTPPWPDVAGLHGRRVAVHGRYDERVQILLRGREHAGQPGVEVVTPLVVGDGEQAVLVNRGWLSAADGATARPQEYPEPENHTVVGVADTVAGGPGPALLLLDAGPPTLYSALAIDLDTVAARLRYAPAPFVVRELPGREVPERPLRRRPEPVSILVHAGYAAQWFLFAAGFLAAGAFLVNRRRLAARR